MTEVKVEDTAAWKFQRKWWEALPVARARDMACSYLLIMDESMSAWTGKTHPAGIALSGVIDYRAGYLPHQSWVPRKPEPQALGIRR